jgi:hypothetical protein
MMGGLEIPERARILGLSYGDYVRMAQADPRIVAHPTVATEGAIARLRRWLDAGRPEADAEQVNFIGADEVREILVDTISKLPTPVAWHAINGVAWLEVGRGGVIGWTSAAPSMKAPPGDELHLIALSGRTSDEALPGLCAHELGHSWTRELSPEPFPIPPMSAREFRARIVAAFVESDEDREDLAREAMAEERLADACAEAWGFPCRGGHSLDRFRHSYSEVAQEADRIRAELDQEEP